MTTPEPEHNEVISRLCTALDKLERQDNHLFEVDANERSFTARLAIYLQEQFVGWDVDCEYNRMGIENTSKRLCGLTTNTSVPPDDEHARTVFPDVIVHKRGTTGPNLLVLEAKKTTGGSSDFDKLKLQEFQSQLRYLHAVRLLLVIGEGGQEPRYRLTWECLHGGNIDAGHTLD